ncbi:hypothetical protein [Mycobacterium avium]|uniref:hypothetical protein n=1 Tax=Mycobacterium avium TaxID=1764 RepID=UPI001CE11D84|nr:hypothetical protein [Mycobacterium avium]
MAAFPAARCVIGAGAGIQIHRRRVGAMIIRVRRDIAAAGLGRLVLAFLDAAITRYLAVVGRVVDVVIVI